MGSIKRACIFFLSTLIMLASLCVFISAPVMADGLPSKTTTNTSLWPISEEQAIAIAAGYLPSNTIAQAHISVTFKDSFKSGQSFINIWKVTFSDVTFTKEELGWEEGIDTVLISTGEYENVFGVFQIYISAETGAALYKTAISIGVNQEPALSPVSTLPQTMYIYEPFPAISIPWYIWLGLASTGFVLIGIIGYLAVKLRKQLVISNSKKT